LDHRCGQLDGLRRGGAQDNLHADGIGIGGGPDTVMGDMVLDKFADPEGHVIGLIASAS